jgi:hypothetical protein
MRRSGGASEPILNICVVAPILQEPSFRSGVEVRFSNMEDFPCTNLEN